ncbi:MAG: hypothetical protein QOC63_2796 [Mycobacterium sp.]|jgi:hypothetical protein|nr:hypothetical protein [Mycobacterium sp.]
MRGARKESVQSTHRRHFCGYTRGMQDITARPGLLRRAWRRVLDGDRRWGSIDIHPDRFGVTRYSLVVFPPGISDSERRWVRVARGWTLWAVLVWMLCEVWLSPTIGPWTALVTSTAIYFGVGLVAKTMAGDPRRAVRTLGVTVIAGHHDPVTLAHRQKLERLAAALLEADELLARGEISATTHEMTWWRVYDQMGPASPIVHESGRGA